MNREYPQIRPDPHCDSAAVKSEYHKIAAIIRHSERFYGTTPSSELMGLTLAGMEYAVEMGQNFLFALPRLYSSPFGRCIETAYLIDKGFTRQHGMALSHNQPGRTAGPVLHQGHQKALNLLKEQGTRTYIRNWLDNRLMTP